MTTLPDEALVVRCGQNMRNPRIYADFQNLDGANRLRLTCAGTQEDLERQGIQLQEGCVLTFYMDDADDEGRSDELLAEGTVRYNIQEQCWVAEVDWTGLRNASEESSERSPPMNDVRAQPEAKNRQAND